MIAGMGPSGATVRVLAGYLVGIALGTMSVTLLFLGMRAVMDVGGACADGGPYVSAQPCPDGVPIAMVGGMFGLFGSAGLVVWFGSRIGAGAASIVALGWPILFIALGYNFLHYAFNPPDAEPIPVWGWLIPGGLFWLMGGAPLVVGLAAWRSARGGGNGNRLSQQIATTVLSRPIIYGPAATSAPDSWRAPRQATAAAGEPPDLVDDLSRLAELHEAGDLTDEEFAAAKDRLLANGDEGARS
jgi:hypothetical protein